MDITIRKMKKRDIPAVRDVARKSWNAAYKGIIPEDVQERFLSYAYSDQMLKKKRRRTHIYVAVLGKEVIGFANFTKMSRDMQVHLYAIYIYPEYQDRKIGSALLEIGHRELGATEITLHVEKQNQKALQFYKRKGFEKIAEFDEDLEGHPLHTIRMARRY
jgi:ribosomal protein S18 acetylase RimI-like enzyme